MFRRTLSGLALSLLGAALSVAVSAAEKPKQPGASRKSPRTEELPSPDPRFEAVFHAGSIDIEGLRARSSSIPPFDASDALLVNRADKTLSRNITACEINQAPADVAVIFDLTRPMSDRVNCTGRHSVTHEPIEVTAQFDSRVTVNGDVLSFMGQWTTDERDEGGWNGTSEVRWLNTGALRITLRIAGSLCELLDYHEDTKEVITHPGSAEPPKTTTVTTEKTPAARCALGR